MLHQEASLQKICALEKKQAVKKLIISYCTPYERTLYCCTITILLYVYTYRLIKCIIPTKLSPPWPVRTANITTCYNGNDLWNMGRQQLVLRQGRWPSLETPGRPGCGVASRTYVWYILNFYIFLGSSRVRVVLRC